MLRCFECDELPTGECPRCGQLYCYDHGDALCDRCADPARSAPSYQVYRGSLLALALGAIFAIWLLISPAADAAGSVASGLRPQPTATRTTR